MPPAPSVSQALAEAGALGVDRLDAQMILGAQLGQSRSWLIAHDDALLSGEQADAVRAALRRRAAGEPVAYLLGEKEFHGLRLEVDANVLVPRPDTEVLVDWALELLAAAPLAGRAALRVVDLGTGSGAIALAVKHGAPRSVVLATDASAEALAVARRNAQRLALDVGFHPGSWWQALPGGERFDLVLSNPPYIAGGDPHLAALVHEPLLALTPGGDGLGALREIVEGAAAHLAPGGVLLLEHGYDQAEAVRALLRGHGFGGVQTRIDLGGQPRCTGGRRDV
ncbi:MAG TPA: peptide chain release factor N(5)-glutamine methyltransferase [Burkholderiaceae bacterium]|jgi:release factor glutamine methyltransferase